MVDSIIRRTIVDLLKVNIDHKAVLTHFFRFMSTNMKKFQFFFFLPTFWLCLISGSYAQKWQANLEYYGIEQGLSHRQINVLYQDSREFIWLGTPYGLNRFDGYHFEWWTKEKNGLPHNEIRALVEDAEGYLWIIADFGRNGVYGVKSIHLLHTETGELLSFKEKFGDQLPVPIQEISNYWITDNKKTIYFGTFNTAKLIQYHPDFGFKALPLRNFESFRATIFAPDQSIWGIADDNKIVQLNKNGQILQLHQEQNFINGRRVFWKDGEVFYEVSRDNKPFEFKKIDKNGQCSIGIQEDFQIELGRLHKIIRALSYNETLEHLWVFSQAYLPLIHSKEGTLFNLYDQYPELLKAGGLGFRGLVFDKTGRFWMGGDYGVYKIEVTLNRFTNYLHQKPITGNNPTLGTQAFALQSCRGIFEDGKQLYINTERNGMYAINLEKYPAQPNEATKHYTIKPPPKLDKAYSIFRDKKNLLWIGEQNLHQLDLISNNLITLPNKNKAIYEDIIWSIHEDKNGRFWLGRGLGLFTMDRTKAQVEPYPLPEQFKKLSQTAIMYINADQAGNVWICSNIGLFLLNIEKGIQARYWSGGKGQYFLPADQFYHFYHDKEGTYWLATAGGGLIKWDKENALFQQFTRADGLSNNTIYAVYEDERDHLWMSSDYGIMQFNKNSHQCKTYLPQDGIPHHEFNRISHFQSKSGRIYFGTLNGVTAFHPNDFYEKDSVTHAPLQITHFQQFDGKQNALVDKTGELVRSNQITLQPDDSFFRLEFTLLTYEDIKQIRYAYKVEGLDQDWNYQKERSIRMSRLPYGNHILKVKGQAANGQWSDKELHLNIKVLKPIYLQNWFLVFGTFLLFGLVWAFYKWRTWEYKQNQRQLQTEVKHQTATIRQQTEELRKLSKAKSHFFANITHEFRTPLTVISGMAGLIKKGASIKELTEIRQLIQRNSKNLLYLVNQLLDLSKSEDGSMQLNLVQGDIIPYLQYLTEALYSFATSKEIRLVFYTEIETLVMDYDEMKIQQIIYNLLSNAIKFTPDMGKVVLHTKQEIIDNQDFLVLKVKDTGIGISKTAQAHIFDRFYQVDGSTTRKGEGTGIGLALTAELVKLMNGKIKVESKAGEGTTFTISLPITKTATTPTITPFNTPQNTTIAIPIDNPQSIFINHNHSSNKLVRTKQPLVLLIEDNPDVVIFIKNCLYHAYQIQVANDGLVGIQKAFELIPDLIISDVMMPEKDGFEVCQTLKTDQRTSHIPIVLLTAKATHEDKLMGLEQGADAYLTKPFDKKELLIRLEKLIAVRLAMQKRLANFSINGKATKKASSLDEQFLQKLQSVVENRLDDVNLGINDLCQKVQLSRTQIYRKLKALTGKTPSQFIRSIRLQKALELLKKGEMNVSEVAYDVGFSHPNYFSRAFKVEFGYPPSEV